MVKFPKHNEITTLHDRVKKSEPEWTINRIERRRENPILDFFRVAKNGSSK